MHVLAIHGMPTSPRLWEKLVQPHGRTLEAPPVPGLGAEGTPVDWSLESSAEALRPQASKADLLVGHDLGGVLAARLASPGQTVVLSGTALGMTWADIRMTEHPPCERYFYRRHQGRKILSQG